MPLWMIFVLVMACVVAALLCWACCAISADISRDENNADLEQDNGVRP